MPVGVFVLGPWNSLLRPISGTGGLVSGAYDVCIDKIAQVSANAFIDSESNFHKKHRCLKKEAKRTYAASPEALIAHTRWLNAADGVRECRNRLVHGRWGIELTKQQVVYIAGLPTSTV